MLPSVFSSIDSHSATQADTTPWWGAWSAFIIVGCFYLTQTVGIFMVQMFGAVGMGLPPSAGEGSALDQTWLLPLSLFVATIGGAMVSVQVAASRVKQTENLVWLWQFIGQSYDFQALWRFVFLGLSFGLGFFALTEYGVLPPDDLPQPIFDAMLAASFLLQIVWVLMFVVLFPVVEEVLFRGFLFTGLSQSWGPSLAGVFTTVAFIAVHMPKVLEYWPALAAVILIGTLTVLIRIRTGSLAPGIALHSTYNGTLVAAAFLTQPIS